MDIESRKSELSDQQMAEHGIAGVTYNTNLNGFMAYLNMTTLVILIIYCTVMGIFVAVTYEKNVGSMSDGQAYLLPHYQAFYSGYNGSIVVHTNRTDCKATVNVTGRVVVDHYNNPTFGGPRMAYIAHLWIVVAGLFYIIITLYNHSCGGRVGESYYSDKEGNTATQDVELKLKTGKREYKDVSVQGVHLRWNNWFYPGFLINQQLGYSGMETHLRPTANYYMLILFVPAMYLMNYWQLQMYGISEVFAINSMCIWFGFTQIIFQIGQGHRYKVLFLLGVTSWMAWWTCVFTAVYWQWNHQQISNEFNQTAYIPTAAAVTCFLEAFMYFMTFTHYLKWRTMCSLGKRLSVIDYIRGHSPRMITFNTFYQLFCYGSIIILNFNLLYYGVLSKARVFTYSGLTSTDTINYVGL